MYKIASGVVCYKGGNMQTRKNDLVPAVILVLGCEWIDLLAVDVQCPSCLDGLFIQKKKENEGKHIRNRKREGEEGKRGTHLVEGAKQGLGGLPVYAGVGDADAALEALLAVGGLLVPGLEVRFDHDAHDPLLALGQLGAHVRDDLPRRGKYPRIQTGRIKK